ncbi:SHOCT domain-containing protein [Kitasatospora sp. NPDC057541]|uniref:SHOCT domain-containing protein n=1 Tax=unclassified Kitasatospora TaxID=2633591 RepID=UPI0036B9C4A6
MTTTPRVSGARKFVAFDLGLFAALGGFGAGTGYLRSFTADACEPGRPCDDGLTALLITGGLLLWLIALFGALGLAENRAVEKPQRLPLGTTSAGVLTLGLLGAAPANGVAHPWMFAAAAPFALLTVVTGVRGERRIRRENADHLRARRLAERLHRTGVTVPGRITGVQRIDRAQGGRLTDPHRLRLDIRYPGPDGRSYTLVHTGTFPVYALPNVGGELAVRHDPRDPSAALATALPATSRPLGDQLETLAALHRDGSLDTAEFTAAKARLLGTGLSAGASGGL